MQLGTRITYNKHHVAIGTSRQNFCWVWPRRQEGYCPFEIKVGDENMAAAKELLGNTGVPFRQKGDDVLAISVQLKVFRDNKDKVEELIRRGWQAFS